MQNFITALHCRDSRALAIAETPLSLGPLRNPYAIVVVETRDSARLRPGRMQARRENLQGLQKNLFNTKAKGVKQ
jgi:hypothetical protein